MRTRAHAYRKSEERYPVRLNLFIFFVLVLIFSGNVTAQESIIAEKEYLTAEKAALAKLEGKNYRKTEMQVSFSEKGNFSTSNVSEYFSPVRKRLVSTTTSPGYTSKTEFIVIGKDSFVNFNNEEWKFYPNAQYFGPPRDPAGIKTPRIIEKSFYLSRGEPKAGGKSVNIYKKSESVVDGSQNTLQEETLWIGRDGLLQKTEYILKDDKGKVGYTHTSTYDYGVVKKIEAPSGVSRGKKN
jgi:hypothetical protein